MQAKRESQSKPFDVIGLLAAAIGVVLMAWGFVAGMFALFGSGANPRFFFGMFLVGTTLLLAALVHSIYRLTRRSGLALAWATIAIGVLPVIAAIVIAFASQA